MNYLVLHDFGTSTLFKGISCDHFKDLRMLKLLTNSDVYLTSFLGGVTNNVPIIKFVPPSGNEVRLTSKFVTSLGKKDLQDVRRTFP